METRDMVALLQCPKCGWWSVKTEFDDVTGKWFRFCTRWGCGWDTLDDDMLEEIEEDE